MSGDSRSRAQAMPMTQRHGNNTRDGGTRTKNMLFMVVTELTSHPPMSWLKALTPYSTARDEWSNGVSGDSRSRAQAMPMTERHGNNTRDGGTRTKNMTFIAVTEPVFQLPMGRLKPLAFYGIGRDVWSCGVRVNINININLSGGHHTAMQQDEATRT